MECGIISPVQETTIPYGALAQLVARYIRIVEVTGSNPVCSTTKTCRNASLFSYLRRFLQDCGVKGIRINTLSLGIPQFILQLHSESLVFKGMRPSATSPFALSPYWNVRRAEASRPLLHDQGFQKGCVHPFLIRWLVWQKYA